MSALPPGEQDRRSVILGWVLLVLFIGIFITSVSLPRTALETAARDNMRLLHFGVASVFLFVVAYRLYWWAAGPKPTPPAGMPAGAFRFARLVQLVLLLTLTLMAISGFTYAWANGFEVRLGAVIPLPALLPVNQATWLLSGYVHSALSFYYLMLFAIALVMGIVHRVRYGIPLRRLLPGRLA